MGVFSIAEGAMTMTITGADVMLAVLEQVLAVVKA
jgi:hypothetical protein